MADLLGAVSESDEVNNALASPVAFQVTRNLTKLTRVSATFHWPRDPVVQRTCWPTSRSR